MVLSGIAGIRLHHVGVVVDSVNGQADLLQEVFGFELHGEPVVDPLQDVKVAFINPGADVLIELIEPLSSDSPVSQFLAKGGGLNHLCYSVPVLQEAIDRLRAKGSLIVSDPKPAAAFNGRRIAFLYTRERQLVELLEEHS